jgi:PEP-CTERM motif
MPQKWHFSCSASAGFSTVRLGKQGTFEEAWNMRKLGWILPAVLLLAAIGAPKANADDSVTDYSINFTQTGGSLASVPTGSFVYDNTTNTFSDFSVDWDGFVFDLTSAANDPEITTPLPSCLKSSSGAHAALSLLTDCANSTTDYWYAEIPQNGLEEFDMQNDSADADGVVLNLLEDGAGANGGNGPISYGSFTTTVTGSTAAPEPASGVLLLLGLGLVGFGLLTQKVRARSRFS